jgi:hypothetical protein
MGRAILDGGITACELMRESKQSGAGFFFFDSPIALVGKLKERQVSQH